MLFDSVSVFGRANRNKKRKRSRVALSKRITRSKENKNNIKNGGLNFENPGSIFKKIDKDMNQNPPKQNEPQPIQPEPPKDNNITDGNMPPIKPLPYVPPYISKFPPKKPKPKEDTDKEVKETIAQLKSQIASAKNTCGAYTQTMTSINKQLGLGVTMTSGIGAGLSAIATTTGAISYGKSKQQDKNFANHKEKQDGIIKMVQNKDSLLNFNGNTGDNDDLTKITATEKTLEDDKILALRKAEEEAKKLRGDLAKAIKEAGDFEQAWENKKNTIDTEEPTLAEDDELIKNLRLANEALDKEKNKRDTPVEEPKQLAKTQAEIDAEKAEAEAKKKEGEAEQAAKALQALKDRVAQLKTQPPSQNPKLTKAQEDLKAAEDALKNFKKTDPQTIAVAKKAADDAKEAIGTAKAMSYKNENLIHKVL